MILSQGRAKVLLFFFSTLLLVLSSCTPQLISTYDEKVENSLMDLHGKLETFFIDMEDKVGTPAADYFVHKEFYNDLKLNLSYLSIRCRAKSHNERTVEQLELLEKSLHNLEEIHKDGIATYELIRTLRDQFTIAMTAILQLELAKKRGL
ncbi:MAG: hypothetical protein ACRBF0_04365 [Calditrichia bacterium]